MKCWWIAIALLTSNPIRAELVVKYDRFKDRTEISAAKSQVQAGGYLNLNWGASFSGNAATARPAASLVILVSNKDWTYLRCHDINFLADGRPVPVGKAGRQGDVHRGYVLEMLAVEIPAASLDILANAEKIEMRVCRTEYTFDDADRGNVRDFARALRP